MSASNGCVCKDCPFVCWLVFLFLCFECGDFIELQSAVRSIRTLQMTGDFKCRHYKDPAERTSKNLKTPTPLEDLLPLDLLESLGYILTMHLEIPGLRIPVGSRLE